MKVPKNIIYQMKLQITAKEKRVKQLQNQIKIMKATLVKMEPINIKLHKLV